MTLLSRLYKKNINGIIITLIFHILVFSVLLLSHFKIGEEKMKQDLIIDFPIQPVEQFIPATNNKETSANVGKSDQLRTNIASNRTSVKQNKAFDDQYQEELEKAQKLIKEVSKQLTKEIPTIDDLKMPDAPKANPEKIKDKIYTGESNIEYFLENRFHLKLPIPVYLAEGGGKVKVNIIVDRLGNVLSADPVIEANLSEQVLSYAKTAALRTKFNPLPTAPAQQNGYLLYNFIPQN
jgi:hypothetical protein